MKDLKFFVAGLILLLLSCTNHNETDYFKDTCNIYNMSFQNNIYPELLTNCVVCHSDARASGGINLEGYENVKIRAQSGILTKVIEQLGDEPKMPLNAAKLPDCTINKINAWIDQGIKNN